MWDKTIITDKNVKSNRPDIKMRTKKIRECYLVDVLVTSCINNLRKEAENITKYRDLEI